MLAKPRDVDDDLVAALRFYRDGATAGVADHETARAASAHRHGCHRWHTCPSDHATYRWRGLLCVAPYSDKRNASFNRRVRYGGRTYYCKR